MNLKWTADISAEQCFEDFGVTVEVGDVQLSQIDWDASSQNQSRITGKPVDDDLTQDYSLAMEGGAQFPRIAVRKTGRKYVIVGGNHRARAAQLLGVETVSAYIVSTTDEYIIDMLPRVLNRLGGRRTDKSEAYQHAIYAINTHSISVAQAAETFNVPVKELSNRIATNELRHRLIQSGVPAQSLSEDKLRTLRVIDDNDNVLNGAAQVILKARLTGEEANRMVKQIKQGRTELARLATISEYEKKLGANGKTATPRTQKVVRQKFLRSLTTMEGVIGRAQTLVRLQITEPEEKANVSERLTDLSTKCRRLAQSV